MTIRVLHSFPVWLPQTQTWLYSQVRHTPADRFESHVVCERVENLAQFGLPNIHAFSELPAHRRLLDRALRRLHARRHLGFLVDVGRRVRADVVHSHFGPVGWADAPAVRRIGARHVVTFYGMDVNKLPLTDGRWRDRYEELFSGVDRVLCEGPHMARCVVALGCPAGKVRVQRLGVDIAGIRYMLRRWSAGTPLRVLIVASFREKKGIPDAIAAIARLRRLVPVEVTIIGDAGPEPASQEEKLRIHATIAEHGMADIVRMLGYQTPTRIFAEAYAHHVFLSPSRTASDGDTEGGSPVSLTEMIASGIPVVSTTHCDIPAVVEAGCTGLLAAEGDVDGLAAHLVWLVQHPEQWSALTRAGRAKVEREFDVVEQGRRLGEHYSDVLES
jgi:colanic acid/amylovoran biosynthesis glycosyltransferase